MARHQSRLLPLRSGPMGRGFTCGLGLLPLAAGLYLITLDGSLPSRAPPASESSEPTAAPVRTFSIVAHDPERKEWGIGVASKFLAVGAVVPWAKAGVGAIATQSYANTSYGSRGLELLAQG